MNNTSKASLNPDSKARIVSADIETFKIKMYEPNFHSALHDQSALHAHSVFNTHNSLIKNSFNYKPILKLTVLCLGIAMASSNVFAEGGIYVNDGTDPSCLYLVDRGTDNTIPNSKSNNCLSDEKASQTDRAVFYGPPTSVGSTSLSLGKELYVNGGQLGLSDQSSNQSMRIGSQATLDATSGQNSIAIGSAQRGGEAGQSTQASGDSAVAIGSAAKANATNTTALGASSIASSGQSTAVGSSAEALGDQSTAIGSDSIASGNSSIAIGSDDLDKATFIDAVDNTDPDSIPNESLTSAAQRYKALTGDNLVNTTDRTTRYISTEAAHAAVAVGVSATAKGDLSTAFGTRANASGHASLALGVGSSATQDNAIALGAGSTTTTNAVSVKSTTINGVTFGGFTGADDIVEGDQVSLGQTGFERQIKNVAAGQVSNSSTDAVNGSQLFSVAEHVSKGLNVKANNDTADNLKLGDTLTLANGTNTTVTYDAVTNTYKHNIVDAPVFSGQVKANGFDSNSQKIVNVKAGTEPTDAVNFAQLTQTNDNVEKAQTTADTALTNAAAAQGTANTALANAAGAQNTANTALTNAETALTAANTADTKATAAQDTANTALANAAGAQSTANTALTTANAADTKATSAQTVANTALTNVTVQATRITNLTDDIIQGQIGLVQQKDPKAVVSVAKDTGGNSLNIIGKDGNRVIQGVANGAVSTTSNDAVNGRQLNATNDYVVKSLGANASFNANTGTYEAPAYSVADQIYNNVGGAVEALNQTDQILNNRVDVVAKDLETAFNTTNNKIERLEKKANAGIAAALALEAAPHVTGKYTYSAGVGHHGGETAVGVTLRKTADSGRWSVTGGVAFATEGDPSVRLGMSGAID